MVSVRSILETSGDHRGDPAQVGSGRTERDSGSRSGLSTDERQLLRDLEREVKELRANKVLKASSAFLRAVAPPAIAEMIAFIDEHRGRWGASRSAGSSRSLPATY